MAEKRKHWVEVTLRAETTVRIVDALKDVVRAQHKPGVGGQAICACGAPSGGTLACGALRTLLHAIDEANDLLIRMGPDRDGP